MLTRSLKLPAELRRRINGPQVSRLIREGLFGVSVGVGVKSSLYRSSSARYIFIIIEVLSKRLKITRNVAFGYVLAIVSFASSSFFLIQDGDRLVGVGPPLSRAPPVGGRPVSKKGPLGVTRLRLYIYNNLYVTAFIQKERRVVDIEYLAIYYILLAIFV